MRVAVFSDVHGNLAGLEAVLADIERHAPDLVVFAGDLCFLGPRPADCLRRLRQRRLPGVIGNTDEWAIGRQPPPEPRRAAAEWTRAQLSPDERDWLGRLPFALRLSPTAVAAHDLLIVHANLRDVNGVIYQSEAEQRAYWGEVRQSDADLAALLGGVTAGVVAYGHLHNPGQRRWGSLTLVNVSSVSLPGDGDPRAKYALLTWNGNHWAAEHHRIAYDAGQEADAFAERQPPGWEAAAESLRRDGVYFP